MIRKEHTTVYCTCNRYEQFGLLCSHIFCVLKLSDIREFPKQYILRRWTREAVPTSYPGAIPEKEAESSERSGDVKRVVGEITYSVEYVINKLASKFDDLCSFRDHVNQFLPNVVDAQVVAPRKSRRDRIAELLGTSQPSTATIRVPIGTRFKGCGSHKRIKSQREQAISQQGKKQRQCQNCMGYGHNIRTCKNPKSMAKESVDNEDDTSSEEYLEE